MNIYMDQNGKYPRYPGDICLVIPGWKDGDALPPGWVKLEETEVPKQQGKTAVFDTPVLIGDKWHVQYKLVDYTPPSKDDPRYQGMPDKIKEQYIFEKWPTE